MVKDITILHYTSPPTVGGVESVIAHQAQGLAKLGYSVRILSGDPPATNTTTPHISLPLLSSHHPRVLAIKQELDQGLVTPAFHALVDELHHALQSALANTQVCIVHNIHTMHKNLALTAALHCLPQLRWIAWCHDLAWTNSQYAAELHHGYPWDLLRQRWQNTRYITISTTRQAELATLLHCPPTDIEVVLAGVEIADFYQWTPTMREIENTLHLLDAELLLLLPARLTRRKNIQFALHILAELRQHTQWDVRLIVTGPPGPHNPTNHSYLDELLALRQALNLSQVAHFLYELPPAPLIPDDLTMANLYQLCDALVFPSLQEGFGIPLLEAGLAGMPIFCSDLPPFHETGQSDVTFFEPEQNPPAQVAEQIRQAFIENPRQRFRTRVRQQYRWEAIIHNRLVPLVEAE